MLPFFYQTCPSSLPPGSHRLFWGYMPTVEPITGEGRRLCRTVSPFPDVWAAQGSRRHLNKTDSFGKGGGGHFIYRIFHSLFLCLEEVDNGVAKTFPPKFCTVWLDGNRLIQGSRGRCRLETQAITTLWIKSKLVLRAQGGAPVLAKLLLLSKRERGGGDSGSSFSCFGPWPSLLEKCELFWRAHLISTCFFFSFT